MREIVTAVEMKELDHNTIPLKKTLNFWEEECTLIQTSFR